MALRFIPPANAQPPQYLEEALMRIPSGLDNIYNSYLQAQELQRQRALQNQQLNTQNIMAGLQYPGVNFQTTTPADVQSAYNYANPRPPAPGTNQPTTGQLGVTPPENPNVAALRQIFEQRKTTVGLERRQQEASARKTESEAGFYEGMAGGGSAPQVQTIGGAQFLTTQKRSGPSFQPLPNQTIPAEIGTKLGLAQDGVENLDFIEQLLKSDRARELMIKSGGSFARLKSLGDPEAESLANAIFQAGDAEARVKTGAAINIQEMDQYFQGLINPVGTTAGNLDRIARKKAFFNNQIRLYSGGRPSAQSDGTPAQGTQRKADYKTADDVKNAVKSGSLSKEQALGVLRKKFGYK